jgi:hypothetical protein
MFRFHILGLSLCVVSNDRMTVLLLNSGFPRTVANVPYHIPSLFMTEQSMLANSVPRLASTVGRWAATTDVPLVGWSLTGLTLRIGGTGAPSTPPSRAANAEHPPMVNGVPDWADLHWILDARRTLPTARLRDEFRQLGENTLGIVEFRGGRLEGGRPYSVGGSQFVWKVRDGYEQAFTDTLDIVFDDGVPEVKAWDVDRRPIGSIDLGTSGEAWLVNEAPERTSGMLRGVPSDVECLDSFVFLEAFDTETPAEKAGVQFARGRRWGNLVSFTEICETMLFDER